MSFKFSQYYQKPREKALKYGIDHLSDYELLALIIRTGTFEQNVLSISQSMIKELNGIENLVNTTYKQLTAFKGIGKCKALEILSCLELSKRINSLNQQKIVPYIISTVDVYHVLKDQLQYLKHENFVLLLLNKSNKIIYQKTIWTGDINRVSVDIKEILHLSLLHRSNKIICVHNHPSGDLRPSLVDSNFSIDLLDKAKFFGITLVDHIIIGKNSCFSIFLNQLFEIKD